MYRYAYDIIFISILFLLKFIGVKVMKKFPMFFLMFLAMIAGFVFMLFMDAVVKLDEMSTGEDIFYFCLAAVFLYIAIMFHIIIHEAGHLVFGLLSGYKFSSFRVGSFMLKKEDGKLKLKRFSLAGTGGQCLMVPPELVNGKMPYFWYNIGGALSNIIFAIVSAMMIVITKDIKGWALFFFMMTLIGVFLGLMNGVPLNMGELDNDGMNIISLSKDPIAIKAMWIQLKMNDYTSNDVSIKDIPDDFFELPENANMKNVLISSVEVFKCNKLMAEGKFEEADNSIKTLLTGDANVAGIYRSLLKLDRAYIEMINENRKDVVDGFVGKTEKDIMIAMKNFPSVIRFCYTYALLVEKDSDKAKEYREQMQNIKKHYPNKIDIEDETELMDIALNKF